MKTLQIKKQQLVSLLQKAPVPFFIKPRRDILVVLKFYLPYYNTRRKGQFSRNTGS